MEPGSALAAVCTWICDQSILALKSYARQATAFRSKVTPESPLEPRALESWVNFIPIVSETGW